MITLVFIVAVTNFALGFAAFHISQRRLGFALPKWRRPPAVDVASTAEHTSSEQNLSQDAVHEPTPQRQNAEDRTPDLETIPTQWLDVLAAEAIEAQSFIEAAVETFRLEVGRYRHDLIEIDDRLRAAAEQRSQAEVTATLADLDSVNAQWLEKQNSAADILAARRGALGSFEEIGAYLHDILAQQTSQIESTRGNLAQMRIVDEVAAGCARPIKELCRLLDLAHSLRDRMQEAMASILRTERRVGEIERRLQFDRETGMYTRLGLEVLLYDWRRDDPPRIRLASMVLVDLDNCGRLNEKLGARRADRLLDAFACQLGNMIRKDRGFDRFARLGGQSFLAFLGDTGPHQATSAAERIRQTTGVLTFEMGGEEIALSISLSVAEMGKSDDSATLLPRLRDGMRLAKHTGRNCTCLDEGQGFQPVAPPIYNVKARVVTVETTVNANE